MKTKNILFYIATVIITLSASISLSAEVVNLQAAVSDKKPYIIYDLISNETNTSADVVLSLELNGKRYTPDKLSIFGEFGKNIIIGNSKKIWWDTLQDMPNGFEGEIIWNIEAISRDKEIKRKELPGRPIITENSVKNLPNQNNLPEKPFQIKDDFFIDSRNNLVWSRKVFPASKTNFFKANELIEKLNKNIYAGFSDWRLPTLREYKSLFKSIKIISEKSGETEIKITKKIFNNYQPWHYWSSTKLIRGFNNFFAFDLEDGSEKLFKSDENNFVIAVRGGNAAIFKRGEK